MLATASKLRERYADISEHGVSQLKNLNLDFVWPVPQPVNSVTASSSVGPDQESANSDHDSLDLSSTGEDREDLIEELNLELAGLAPQVNTTRKRTADPPASRHDGSRDKRRSVEVITLITHPLTAPSPTTKRTTRIPSKSTTRSLPRIPRSKFLKQYEKLRTETESEIQVQPLEANTIDL